MRLPVVAAALLSLPVIARADTVDLDLKLVPQAGNPFLTTTYDISFLLPRSPTPSLVGNGAFLVTDAVILNDSIPGLPQALPIAISTDAVAFDTSSVNLDAYYNTFGFGLEFSGPIFSGTLASPTFNLGTYRGAGAFGLAYTDVLTITSVPDAIATTPEPSSIALLGTGALCVAGVLRRRPA